MALGVVQSWTDLPADRLIEIREGEPAAPVRP